MISIPILTRETNLIEGEMTALFGSKTGDNMDAKEYFEQYKDKIRQTAEFLCQSEEDPNVDKKYEDLRNQYYNGDGTNHSETIDVSDKPLPISKWLELIRHDEVENFSIIAMSSTENRVVYHVKGKQHSSYDISLDDIDRAVLDFIEKYSVSSLGLYIYHNHPYIYKASPSKADFNALEFLIKELDKIDAKAKQIGIDCKAYFIDFSIVTEFDYWSTKQSIK